MNKDNNDPARLIGALTLIFIALRCFGVIAWGWVWLLSPLWIITAIGIIGIVIGDFSPNKNTQTKDNNHE